MTDNRFAPLRLALIIIVAMFAVIWLVERPAHGAAAHVCHVPKAAYGVSGMTPYEYIINARDQRILARYTYCVCGPEGANDAPIVPDKNGVYFYNPAPACERSGWNGHRYQQR